MPAELLLLAGGALRDHDVDEGAAQVLRILPGGPRGLGRATARLLAQRGAAVCVNYAEHWMRPRH
jgi:hypothetical protein